MFDSPKNYNISDPHPDNKIEEIPTYSQRVLSLYAKTHKKMDRGHQSIYGAIMMIGGLEYHFSNFSSAHQRAHIVFPYTSEHIILMESPEYRQQMEVLKHETIAYLNRLGQFRVFVRSQFVQSKIGPINLPKKIEKILYYFRDRYSAHRAIDKSPDVCALDTFYLGTLRNKDGNIMFQYQDKGNDFLNLDLIESHPYIMDETSKILMKVIEDNISLT